MRSDDINIEWNTWNESQNTSLASLLILKEGMSIKSYLASGLSTDPYVIEDCYWTEAPETVPDMQLSDMIVYMIATPSP